MDGRWHSTAQVAWRHQILHGRGGPDPGCHRGGVCPCRRPWQSPAEPACPARPPRGPARQRQRGAPRTPQRGARPCFCRWRSRLLILLAAWPDSNTLHSRDKARYNPRAMSGALLDEAMKAQLAVEWERFRKAFSQAGEIGELNLEEWRIVAERDRKGLPTAVSFVAVQRPLTLEKAGLRGQAFRGGGGTKDPTMRQGAPTQAHEDPIQDAGYSEVDAGLA